MTARDPGAALLGAGFGRLERLLVFAPEVPGLGQDAEDAAAHLVRDIVFAQGLRIALEHCGLSLPLHCR